MSPKKLTSLLPPKRGARRDAGVNVRFTQDEYDELERIAEYRAITVTELIYHVVAQFALPNLVEEMEAEIAAAQVATANGVGQSDLQPPTPLLTTQETNTNKASANGLAPKPGVTSVRSTQGNAINPDTTALKDQKPGSLARPNSTSNPLAGENSN